MTGTQAQTDHPTQEPRRDRIQPATVAASALALGALALPEPTRMGAGQRHLLRLARSAYVGWYTADMVRRTPMPETPAPVFGAVAGVAAALATAPIDEAGDRWLATRLRSWGVRRPRLAMALVGAGMGAFLALENQNRPAVDAASMWQEPADLFDTVEVPSHARALVEAMLDAVASTSEDVLVPASLAESATTLRAQLDQAQASVLRGWPLTTDINFEVPEDAPRVVPHAQGWPVRAYFEAGGLPLQVELWIAGGRLSGLNIMVRDSDLAEDDERWSVDVLDVLETWPAPEQVRLVIETEDDYRPVG